MSKLQDMCTTKEINAALVSACLDRFDEGSFKLAGRILVGEVYKDAYGSHKSIPTLTDHYEKMVSSNYWTKMDYTNEEISSLNDLIKHDRDLSLTYSEIKQINDKYLLRNRTENITLESPQMKSYTTT